jgi:hypothetical protein
MEEYARDFEAGRLPIIGGKDEDKEVDAAVRALIRARHTACDRALMAISRPEHWAHSTAREALLGEGGRFGWERWDSHHPFCIPILSGELGKTELNGASWDQLTRYGKRSITVFGGFPEWLSDPAGRLKTVRERHCDQAAGVLSGQIAGVREFHPLLRDADWRIGEIRAFLSRYEGRIRRTTEEEVTAFGTWAPPMIPDIRPLGRAATAADVKAGRAVFHLSGKGKVAKTPTPAAVEVKGERGLVVQAEADAKGRVHYGVIFRHSIRSVEAKDATAATGPKE